MCLRARDDTAARRRAGPRRQTHGPLRMRSSATTGTGGLRSADTGAYLIFSPNTRTCTQNPHADTHTLQPAPHALNQSRHPTPVSGWRLRPHLPDLRPAGLPLLLQAGLIG